MESSVQRFWVIKFTLFCVLTISMVTLGCVNIRLLTYPQAYSYINNAELHTTMHRMSASMRRLDFLASAELGSTEKQTNVVAEIDQLHSIALELQGGVVDAPNNMHISRGTDSQQDADDIKATRHLLIDEYLDDFLLLVANAREQTLDTPPNYFGVGRIIGGCDACHRP